MTDDSPTEAQKIVDEIEYEISGWDLDRNSLTVAQLAQRVFDLAHGIS